LTDSISNSTIPTNFYLAFYSTSKAVRAHRAAMPVAISAAMLSIIELFADRWAYRSLNGTRFCERRGRSHTLRDLVLAINCSSFPTRWISRFSRPTGIGRSAILTARRRPVGVRFGDDVQDPGNSVGQQPFRRARRVLASNASHLR